MSSLFQDKSKKSIIVLLLVGIGIGAFGMLAFDYSMKVTSTDEFCTSCHEMSSGPQVMLEQTPHYSNQYGVRPGCSDCHVPHSGIPKLWRKIQASREVWGHITGKIDTPEKYLAHADEMKNREIARLQANDSQECRNCHQVEAMDFEQQSKMARRSHMKMQEKNKTCIDCHAGVAHDGTAHDQLKPSDK
jgi:cytochrome c-type protein NapC